MQAKETTSPKRSRRTQHRTTRRPAAGGSLPVLPIAVGLVFVAILAALAVYAKGSNKSTPPAATAAHNIPCQSQSYDTGAVHYHTHLDIFVKGQQKTVPADIGIQSNCLHWLHTHDTSGVIHIEAPKSQAKTGFTLGDFFSVWGQPLSPQQVASYPVSSGEHLVVYVNGKAYHGDPASIVLRAHEDITLEIAPPSVPPPVFKWPSGL